MLCTFTTKLGNLIVRSDDIRSLEDHVDGGAFLVWVIAGEHFNSSRVLGTAIENRDRIQQEELDLIDRVNQHHLQAQAQAQMQQQMMQPTRTARGKQSTT